jgi:hypothetical protein
VPPYRGGSIPNHTSLLTLLHRAAAVSEGLPRKSPRRERQPSRTHPHPPARPSLPLPVPVPCTHASRVLGHQGFPCSHHAPSTDRTWRLPRTPQHESWRVHPPNEAGPAAPSSIRSHSEQRACSASHLRHHRRECVPYAPQQLTKRSVQSSSGVGLARACWTLSCGAAAQYGSPNPAAPAGGYPQTRWLISGRWKGTNRGKQCKYSPVCGRWLQILPLWRLTWWPRWRMASCACSLSISLGFSPARVFWPGWHQRAQHVAAEGSRRAGGRSCRRSCCRRCCRGC